MLKQKSATVLRECKILKQTTQNPTIKKIELRMSDQSLSFITGESLNATDNERIFENLEKTRAGFLIDRSQCSHFRKIEELA